MARSCWIWLYCHILTISTVSIMARGLVCTQKDSPISEIPRDAPPLSDCLMGCTSKTYVKMLETQDTRSVRITDSHAGDNGDFCWSMPKCIIGETLQHAYVVLDVSKAGEREPLRLRSTFPYPSTETLMADRRPTSLPLPCGIPFDVTAYINAAEREPTFCVNLIQRKVNLGYTILKCPPFMMTVLQKGPNGGG